MKTGVRELASLAFVAEATNILLLGPPGVGKTRLAVPLALKAIGQGLGAYFVRAYDLMEDLRRARAEHNLERRLRVYLAPKVLTVDEFGIWPYDRESATAFFTLVSARVACPEPAKGNGAASSSPPTRASRNGASFWGISSSPARSWTGCCTTPTSSTSGERTTG